MKPSFKSFLKTLPPLKKIDAFSEERLPYVFDLHWDIKNHKQLIQHCNLHGISDDMKRYLSEHGYDTKEFEKQIYG